MVNLAIVFTLGILASGDFGESGNFGECFVSCKSSESSNLNVFGGYDECGNFCECCYFG